MTVSTGPLTPRLARGSRVRIECERLVHRGLGLGRYAGQVIFAFGALPGEEVTVEITSVHRRHAFADTVVVHRASSDRVVPLCPYFGVCGGCQLQHASYRLQLELKEEVLAESLQRHGLRMPEGADALGAAEPWGYRWRGEFHLLAGRSGLGFTERGSFSVVEVESCPIHHPSINQVLGTVGPSVKGQRGHPETLQLTVGAGGAEVLVKSRPKASLSDRVVSESASGNPVGVRLTGEATEIDYRGRSFRVYSDSFIQVNQGSLDRLYETVVDWLRPELPGSKVVDAYGGSGWLSLRLADEGARVTVLEQSPVSARLSELHAEMYRPGTLEVLCGSVEELLPGLEGLTVAVLDPPRSGLAPQVSGWLAMAGPPTVVYLSCEVSALARDLEALCRLGPYELDQIRLVDMFPQTYHFETVALLRRK